MSLCDWIGLGWIVSGYMGIYCASRAACVQPEAPPRYARWQTLLWALLLPINVLCAIFCGPFAWMVSRAYLWETGHEPR